MAWAIIKAPSKKRITQCPMEEKARVTEKTPHIASSARPRSPDIGMGIASVIHQITTQTKIPRVLIPKEVASGRGGNRKAITRKARGPSPTPMLRLASSNLISAGVNCCLMSSRSCQPMYFSSGPEVKDFTPCSASFLTKPRWANVCESHNLVRLSILELWPIGPL